MPTPVPPHIKYRDASRRCTRCGMVVLPQAAYCSTCGTAQSLAYTPWQVFGQLIRLWLAVVCVIYVATLVWRFALPTDWAYAVHCVVSGGDSVWPSGEPVLVWLDVCVGPHELLRQSNTVPAFIAVPLADLYEYVFLDGVTAMARFVMQGEQRVVQWGVTAGISLQSWWCAYTSWRWFCV